MISESPARALTTQLQSESDLLLSGDIGTVLEGLDAKRSLIERLKNSPGDRSSTLDLRSAASRQLRLLRAALAGLNAARSHLANAANPAPVSSYSQDGIRNPLSPSAGTTLKKL